MHRIRPRVVRLVVPLLLVVLTPGCWFLDLFASPQKPVVIERGPPPLAPVDRFVMTLRGRMLAGNEWTVPVGKEGIELEAAMTVRQIHTRICSVQFRLSPAAGPSNVTTRVLLREDREFRVGRHVFKVVWDGKDDAGIEAPPAKYQLYGELEVRTGSCDGGDGGGHHGFGLGKLKIARADGRATPDFNGPGGANACSRPAPGGIVTLVLAGDAPRPKCITVLGDQKLNLESRLGRVTAQLGDLEFAIPTKETMTLTKRFRDFLTPGGYYLRIKNGYTAEVIYRTKAEGGRYFSGA
jgi:hypothetical protein